MAWLLCSGYVLGYSNPATFQQEAAEGGTFMAEVAGVTDGREVARYFQDHFFVQGGRTAYSLPSVWVRRSK